MAAIAKLYHQYRKRLSINGLMRIVGQPYWRLRDYLQGGARRETQNKLHKLHDILMMVLCAVLSGVEDWVGMEAFAEEKEAWLRGFWPCPTAFPHTTP